jgi:hypothetical protein
LGGVTTLTTEKINEKMIPKGFKLLTTEYSNNSTVMEWECQECLGTFPDKLINLQRSLRCKCCNGVKKHSVESIREEFLVKGFELLSTEYVDNTTGMEWKHLECGEVFPCGLRNMQRALYCRVCEGPNEYTVESIRGQIQPFGIFLLSEEYTNQDQLLNWVCIHCGHEWEKSRTVMTDHCFCPECRDDKPLSMIEINERMKKRPFICITEGIHLRSAQVEWQCTNEECKHTWFRSFVETGAWGGDCVECRDHKPYTVQFIKEKLLNDERNIVVVTDLPDETLTPAVTNMRWKCLICTQEWPTVVGSVMSGETGCPKCNKTSVNKIIAERNKKQWLKEDGKVYVIKCWDEETGEVFYKIGVTIRKTVNRTYEIPYTCEVLTEINTNRHDMYYIEQDLHQINSATSYLPKKHFGGKHECFSSVIGF